MDIKGKVHEVSATMQVTESLKKRELILEYIENPQYPEYLKFEAIQDRCNLLDSVKPGDDVEVFFNLKGRPWTDKTGKKTYFNSMQLWKVNVTSGNAAAGNAAPQYATPANLAPSPGDDDDLPF
jgi:single-stranded DNA-binding protein